MKVEGVRVLTDPRARRGRPMRLPIDSTPVPGMQVDSARRTSWLVATARLYSERSHLRHRPTFAGELTAVGIRADQTRISRWESGAATIPDRAIAGYGRVLGFQPGRLLTVSAGVRRSLDPSAPASPLAVPERPLDPPARDAMFERIQAGKHTGVDWTLLACLVEEGANLYLPPAMWSDLCERLLREMFRSTHFGWVRRYEAARTLTRHPGAQRAMLKAIGAEVTTPGAQSIESAISLLQEIDDPHVTDLLIRMLATSKGATRRGAAWTIAGKLARGQLGEDEIDAVTELLPRLLLRRTPPRIRAGALDILAALPPGRADQLVKSLNGSWPIQELRATLRSCEIVPPDRARRLASTIARRTEAALTTEQYVESDEMLARLIREALFHVHRERRHHAAVLLAVSPYAAPLADCVLATLAGADQSVLGRGLSLMMYLRSGTASHGKLMTWASHYPVPWLRSRAILTLGYVNLPIDAAAQRRLADHVIEGGDFAASSVHTLGLTRSSELERLVEHAAKPRMRTCAQWWLDLGEPIDDEPGVDVADGDDLDGYGGYDQLDEPVG